MEGYTREYLVRSAKSSFLSAKSTESEDFTAEIIAAYTDEDGPKPSSIDRKTLKLDDFNIHNVIAGVKQIDGSYKLIGKDLIKADLANDIWVANDNNVGLQIEQGIENNITINCWVLKDGKPAQKKGGAPTAASAVANTAKLDIPSVTTKTHSKPSSSSTAQNSTNVRDSNERQAKKRTKYDTDDEEENYEDEDSEEQGKGIGTKQPMYPPLTPALKKLAQRQKLKNDKPK